MVVAHASRSDPINNYEENAQNSSSASRNGNKSQFIEVILKIFGPDLGNVSSPNILVYLNNQLNPDRRYYWLFCARLHIHIVYWYHYIPK